LLGNIDIKNKLIRYHANRLCHYFKEQEDNIIKVKNLMATRKIHQSFRTAHQKVSTKKLILQFVLYIYFFFIVTNTCGTISDVNSTIPVHF